MLATALAVITERAISARRAASPWLKGEKVKGDSGCVVTQRTLALLVQALIKYLREALALLVLQRGDRQPKLLSARSECHHWQSTQETRRVLNPSTPSAARPPTAYRPCGYLQEGGTALSFWITLILFQSRPIPSPLPFKKKRFMWSLADFTVLIIFFPL